MHLHTILIIVGLSVDGVLPDPRLTVLLTLVDQHSRRSLLHGAYSYCLEGQHFENSDMY